ncbi:hypothetical protein C8R44DRAFT_443614 [Mycena epipterygia]|nr:hypothetical protein C8R44DRAFT_443614 [Mycena epipterygia]
MRLNTLTSAFVLLASSVSADLLPPPAPFGYRYVYNNEASVTRAPSCDNSPSPTTPCYLDYSIVGSDEAQSNQACANACNDYSENGEKCTFFNTFNDPSKLTLGRTCSLYKGTPKDRQVDPMISGSDGLEQCLLGVLGLCLTS